MNKYAMFAFSALIVGAMGCSDGPKIVLVSGVVKVNGKPYKDAVVSFQPMGSKDNLNPGRGSSGVTDANGKYTLSYDGKQSGAAVGRHRVRIFTKYGAEPPPEGEGEESKTTKGKRFQEPIPAEWHENSEKEFEVPRNGTDQANFDIETKPNSK
jgi:hypothetical protein